jgi:hypothetical protein
VDVGNGFADLFAKTLCPECEHQEIDGALLKRAEAIAVQKYGAKGWLLRR